MLYNIVVRNCVYIHFVFSCIFNIFFCFISVLINTNCMT
nr:MAG TPA: hypothetical protein [Caudoviricetes sp.]